MTMKAVLVNAGNRTGDKLHIAVLDEDGVIISDTIKTIVRGEVVNIFKYLDDDCDGKKSIRIWTNNNQYGNDEFIGNPCVQVFEIPKFV